MNMSQATNKSVVANCNALHHALDNTTFLVQGFVGIPENLLVNVSIWLILCIILIFLKYYSWRRGQMGILHVYHINFVQVFYSDVKTLIMTGEPPLNNSTSSQAIMNTPCCCGFFKWLGMFWIKNKEFYERCGPDAKLYISFEAHILMFLFINACLSVFFILPLNLLGSRERNQYFEFSKTTFSNLSPDSVLTWGHVIVSFITVLICVAVMRHFTRELFVTKKSIVADKTVMLSHISSDYRSIESLQEYFKIYYPNSEIEEIKMIHHFGRLLVMRRNLWCTENAKLFCEYVHDTYNEDIVVKDHCWCCFYFCRCDCGCRMGPGRLYYRELLGERRHQFVLQLRKIIRNRPEIAFITFKTAKNAREVKNLDKEKQSHLPDRLWSISEAPASSDIIWENISLDEKLHKCKIFFVNALVFFFVFFLTTPAIIMESTGVYGFMKWLKNREASLFSEFFPTAIVTILALSLGPLVSYSSTFLPYQTKSSLSKSVMTRTYFFLIFSVVILPALGLTSLQSLMLWIFKEPDTKYQWQCIFIPDNGAFFVNYVITAAFIGNLGYLFRLNRIVYVLLCMMFSKSEAEKITAYKESVEGYYFSIRYASMLLIFTLVNFYSVSVPLIAPCGLLYMCLTYSVDRHNLYFSSAFTKSGIEVHALAVKFVYFTLVLKNLGIFSIFLLRGDWCVRTTVMLLILLVTLFICIYHMKFACMSKCYNALERTDSESTRLQIQQEEIHEVYFPKELIKYADVFENLYYCVKYNSDSKIAV